MQFRNSSDYSCVTGRNTGINCSVVVVLPSNGLKKKRFVHCAVLNCSLRCLEDFFLKITKKWRSGNSKGTIRTIQLLMKTELHSNNNKGQSNLQKILVILEPYL